VTIAAEYKVETTSVKVS